MLTCVAHIFRRGIEKIPYLQQIHVKDTLMSFRKHRLFFLAAIDEQEQSRKKNRRAWNSG